jgi:hypothetical protein
VNEESSSEHDCALAVEKFNNGLVIHQATLCALSPLVLALPLLGQCNPRYFRSMDINPASLIVQFSSQYSQPCGQPPQDSYFERFDRIDLTLVDYIVPNGRGLAASRLGYFDLSPGLKLQQRRKTQELFSGAFGQVFTNISYQYDVVGGSPAISFQVRPYRSSTQHEEASVVSALPSAANQLNEITVIRAFRSTSGESVAVATYDPGDGDLRDITVDLKDKDDWKSTPVRLEEGIGTFGFPAHFSVDMYRDSPKWLFPSGARSSYLTVVSFHYNHNRWVQQDVFEDGDKEHGHYKTRFLEYKFTGQDSSLEPFDQTLPWSSIDRRRELTPK